MSRQPQLLDLLEEKSSACLAGGSVRKRGGRAQRSAALRRLVATVQHVTSVSHRLLQASLVFTTPKPRARKTTFIRDLAAKPDLT